MSVSYNEIEAWPREEIDLLRGSFKPVRKLRCAWDDRLDLIDELKLTVYPYLGQSTAIAVHFACEPFPKSRMGGTDSIATYDDALVTVTYSTERVALDGSGYYFSEQLLPAPGFHLPAKNTANPGEVPVVTNSDLKYIITYYQLPTFDANWVFYKDHVNAGIFYTKALDGLYFPVGTVRYDGPTLSHALSHRGVIQYTASLQFSYTHRGGFGWQSAWDSDNYEWVAKTMYPTAAFIF